MRRAQRASALIVASMSLAACHRAPAPPYEATPAECRAAREYENGRVVHIDGPRMNMPQSGDTLVIIVNDREAWRGTYDPCHPAPGHYAAALDHVIPATDSVVSFVIEHGAAAAARYHVGGTRVTAYVFRTAPPPE